MKKIFSILLIGLFYTGSFIIGLAKEKPVDQPGKDTFNPITLQHNCDCPQLIVQGCYCRMIN